MLKKFRSSSRNDGCNQPKRCSMAFSRGRMGRGVSCWKDGARRKCSHLRSMSRLASCTRQNVTPHNCFPRRFFSRNGPGRYDCAVDGNEHYFAVAPKAHRCLINLGIKA